MLWQTNQRLCVTENSNEITKYRRYTILKNYIFTKVITPQQLQKITMEMSLVYQSVTNVMFLWGKIINSGAPLWPKDTKWSTMGKQTWQPIDVRNFGSDASAWLYIHMPIQTMGGGGNPKATHLREENTIFYWRENPCSFGQPAFSCREITWPWSLLKKRFL